MSVAFTSAVAPAGTPALSGHEVRLAAHAAGPQVPDVGPSPSTVTIGGGRCLASAAVPFAAAAVLAAARRRRCRGGSSARSARVRCRAAVGSTSEANKQPAATSRQGVATMVDVAPPEIDFDETSIEPSAMEDPAEHEQYDWFKAWYPVHCVEWCDPGRPHKTQLLGMNLVVWNDGPTVDGKKEMGEWHVFEDACPHRKAPLSEGRVEDDGSLLCSYHAWRFNGEGNCSDLPYSPDHLQEKHKCSCRAKCKVFPTRVEDGLLFVWPDHGPDALQESAEKDPPLIEELHDPELSKKWIRFPVNLRDLELGWDVFFENAMDPAHFLVAHHNVTGNRYTDPKWFDMKTWRKIDTQNGVAVRGIPGIFDFRPPCLVKNQQDGGVIFAIYNTPTTPGHCRHHGFLVLDTDTIAGESGVVDKDAVAMFTGPVPIWLQHVLTSFFLHQDAVLLHHQEQNFKDYGFQAMEESEKKFREVTYTPNEVDKGSIQFRRWLRTRAGGGVPWRCDPRLPPRLQSNEKIFDVWNSHTKHCKYCTDAYNNFKVAEKAAFASAFGVALAAPEGPEKIAAGVFFVAVGAAINKFTELFKVYEFNHQDNR